MDEVEHRVDDFLDDDGENWLHAAWVVCPACGQWLLRLDQSPLDNSAHLYCDRCPVRMEVVPYGPEYEQIVQSARPHQEDKKRYAAAVMRGIEARLKPCTCGGTFRFDAPRRCFSCTAPVILADPEGVCVDLYLNDDGFSQDAALLKRFEAWRVRFMPDVDNEWKVPSETES
jgi:hypothetical protein